MSATPLTPKTKLSATSKRRRALPGAATVAALALAGCGMWAQPAAAPMSPQRLEADQKVKQYQSDIEMALDNVDRDRLRAAAERRAAAAPATGPSQAPVILATSTFNETPGAPLAAGHPTPLAPASGATPGAAPGALPGNAEPAARPVEITPPREAGPAGAGPLSVETSIGGVVVVPLSGEPARIPAAEITSYSPLATPSAWRWSR